MSKFLSSQGSDAFPEHLFGLDFYPEALDNDLQISAIITGALVTLQLEPRATARAVSFGPQKAGNERGLLGVLPVAVEFISDLTPFRIPPLEDSTSRQAILNILRHSPATGLFWPQSAPGTILIALSTETPAVHLHFALRRDQPCLLFLETLSTPYPKSLPWAAAAHCTHHCTQIELLDAYAGTEAPMKSMIEGSFAHGASRGARWDKRSEINTAQQSGFWARNCGFDGGHLVLKLERHAGDDLSAAGNSQPCIPYSYLCTSHTILYEVAPKGSESLGRRHWREAIDDASMVRGIRRQSIRRRSILSTRRVGGYGETAGSAGSIFRVSTSSTPATASSDTTAETASSAAAYKPQESRQRESTQSRREDAHTVLDLEERYLSISRVGRAAGACQRRHSRTPTRPLSRRPSTTSETTSGPQAPSPKKESLRTIPSATETACPPRGFTNKLPPGGGQRQLSGYQSRPSRISMALLAHPADKLTTTFGQERRGRVRSYAERVKRKEEEMKIYGTPEPTRLARCDAMLTMDELKDQEPNARVQSEWDERIKTKAQQLGSRGREDSWPIRTQSTKESVAQTPMQGPEKELVDDTRASSSNHRLNLRDELSATLSDDTSPFVGAPRRVSCKRLRSCLLNSFPQKQYPAHRCIGTDPTVVERGFATARPALTEAMQEAILMSKKWTDCPERGANRMSQLQDGLELQDRDLTRLGLPYTYSTFEIGRSRRIPDLSYQEARRAGTVLNTVRAIHAHPAILGVDGTGNERRRALHLICDDASSLQTRRRVPTRSSIASRHTLTVDTKLPSPRPDATRQVSISPYISQRRSTKRWQARSPVTNKKKGKNSNGAVWHGVWRVAYYM
ncbi:hypothetical protein HYFRA_00005889 [Hymenoscyphus fraxineus]|uniref:Uncharacterized protein n=1 Tax=Hymenoscyphus fraxineus TaxID=746836 RepID=A0A9N9KUR5_9HELO|nr:hypothetical protein HYFRA_00005889 [Hymenoscyphus fraxineus]